MKHQQPQMMNADPTFQVIEARRALAEWDAKNEPDVYGTERVLADHLRNMIALAPRPCHGCSQPAEDGDVKMATGPDGLCEDCRYELWA